LIRAERCDFRFTPLFRHAACRHLMLISLFAIADAFALLISSLRCRLFCCIIHFRHDIDASQPLISLFQRYAAISPIFAISSLSAFR